MTSQLFTVLYRLTGLPIFSAEARARRARFNQALIELERMSARDLAELGLSRVDIRRVARETASMA
jgi:uncharacterized protein YjiS (DUF1127 family)